MPIIAVYVRDWAYYSEQVLHGYKFEPLMAWVVSILVSEGDEKVVIAHQTFLDQKSYRHTSAIPKACIITRHTFTVDL